MRRWTIAMLVALAPATFPIQDEAEDELPIADAAEAERLLLAVVEAVEAEDAVDITAALEKLKGYGNPEFLEPALDALSYKASKVDKKRVKEEAETFGVTSKKENDQRLLDLEIGVQVAGAQVLAGIPGKESTSALHKLFKKKDVRKERPTLAAAAIESLGQLGFDKATKDVDKAFREMANKDIVSSAVRFFGQTKCKDKGIVIELCRMLDPPEQPTANRALGGFPQQGGGQSERYKIWDASRRNVEWSLEQITGQKWKAVEYGASDEDKKESDAKKAVDYVKKNARKLGLK